MEFHPIIKKKQAQIGGLIGKRIGDNYEKINSSRYGSKPGSMLSHGSRNQNIY